MSEGCRDLPVHGVMLSVAGVSKLLLTDSAAHLPALLNTLLLFVF